jgi:hypothetical protein
MRSNCAAAAIKIRSEQGDTFYMKTLRAIISTLVFAAISTTFAQQPVTPTPHPAGNSPSLVATMQLIQKELNAVGKLSFVVHVHDNEGGTDRTTQYNSEVSKVVADHANCTIRYHWRSSIGDDILDDTDYSFSLHDVQGMAVMTYEQFAKEMEDKDKGGPNAQPTWYAKYNPPMFMVIPQIAGYENGEYGFVLADEEMANRVAKAMAHAVELCGGKNVPL